MIYIWLIFYLRKHQLKFSPWDTYNYILKVYEASKHYVNAERERERERGGRETETETETERGRERQRQRGGQTDRDTDTETETQTDRDTERHTQCFTSEALLESGVLWNLMKDRPYVVL